MTGLLFLALVAFALGACVWIASAVGSLATSPRIRAPLGSAILLDATQFSSRTTFF